jgi:serine/threonine protein kinase
MSDVSRVEEVFLAAVEQPDPALRATYLDAACGGDEDFRRRVETLLAAQPQVGRFLESPVDFQPSGDDQARKSKLESTASVGDRVGPYKLLERIGEGGMGEVWVADQQEPIKRRVALKLIKPGMDSRSVLGRFEAERQALAVMDHPNIAKVLDAGTTTDGRPYFVMELVKGTPITEFADARKLTPRERLELFVPVCQAIQHAHMKGIIHRDIKPSNVLVELHDDRLVPKVIDFGVAKAVGQQLTEKTIYTGFGALVGTPTYMAPEQATFNALDVDTRADVYALGVLLYELLAGSPPIEKERLKQAALDEVLRIVRDEEPPRPSQRLSTSQLKASIAATRGSEPLQLSQLMRGELDWIVMKALEKDRTRRYESANGFASDIQRYLTGEQVQAVPPSFAHRLKKAYRRNRAAVLVSTAFTALIVSAAIVGLILAVQARRAEALAESKRIEAEEQKAKVELSSADYRVLSETYHAAVEESEVRNVSSRLDADLLEYKSDSRLGLLLLARPLNDIAGPLEVDLPSGKETLTWSFPHHPELQKLREFQTAAVISAGQEFVPLVPPFITPDESSVTASPDGLLCIGGAERTGLELLAIPSLKKVGTLQEDTERVLKFGFSPDGKTIYTQDPDSIVRFWNADGTLRASTPLRPERFIYPVGMTFGEIRRTAGMANPIVVSDGVSLLSTVQPDGVKSGREASDWNGRTRTHGACDLYDNRTGKFLRRLDRPGRRLSDWQISPDTRWLIYREDSVDEQGTLPPEKSVTEIVVLSTADGRELSRLQHRGTNRELEVSVSSFGKWMVTYQRFDWAFGNGELSDVTLWRASDWTQIKDAALEEALSHLKDLTYLNFVTDDILELSSDSDLLDGIVYIGKPGSWTSRKEVLTSAPRWDTNRLRGELGGLFLRQERLLFTYDPINRLKPPPGRKYASQLAQLAPDGRFFESLDTVTEKELPIPVNANFVPGFEGPFVPGIGRVNLRTVGGEPGAFATLAEPFIQILPDPKRLDIQPELLELWAQVVVGGELGEDGTFENWDQPTWAAKQRELAAVKPPYTDFPFPGWAASEPHLWHRIRASALTDVNESDKFLREWKRLTGRTRPDLDPDTWRTPELAPISNEANTP